MRLIDADALLNKCYHAYPSIDHYCTSRNVVDTKDVINAPTIDAVPVEEYHKVIEEYHKVIKERDDAIEKADALKWISVKDKNNRPKDGEQVWCYGSRYYFTAYYDEVQETDYGMNPFGFYELHINPVSLGAEDEEYIESCATHWMPLPKPPEDGV